MRLDLTGVSAVPTIASNTFANTPIAGFSTSSGAYGSIYVDASMYWQFVDANVWSGYESRIVSV